MVPSTLRQLAEQSPRNQAEKLIQLHRPTSVILAFGRLRQKESQTPKGSLIYIARPLNPSQGAFVSKGG